ncbi:Alpha-MPP [Plasmodiophora brassicae]|uniref:Mitochondrial-processing peptidase subunit alpha n=1 Tax=Plasmodiophora brassicae TaxID=37360 RepID=A0A0G4IYC8_PLABS|nr:hypothetical protein PBRA_001412 [Plasmodiophora brassicae]SPQ94134.1 unnamed protein product [Plasmodiophora brassicae]
MMSMASRAVPRMASAAGGRRWRTAISQESRSIFDRILGRTASRAVPLDTPFPLKIAPSAVPEATSGPVDMPPAEVTKLANGVRVVSTTSVLPGASVGLMIAGGSRYAPLPGLPHVLSALSLQSSTTRSEIAAQRAIGELGGQFASEANRDFISIRADVLPNDAHTALEIIADVARNGTFDPEEINSRVDHYRHQIEHVLSRDVETITQDALHSAAFNHKGLGLPLHATLDNVNALRDPAVVKAFRDSVIRPDRIVVVGAGVDHGDLVHTAKKALGDMQGAGEPAPAVASPYVGGEFRSSTPSHDGFVHVALGFGCGGWKSDDVYAVCALSMLMGGGGSFSAGGPGKGMYSRLYMRVLTGNAWVQSALCHTALHDDVSVLSLQAFGAPEDGSKLMEILVREAKMMSRDLSTEEVERAKNQLKSSLFMNLEQRQILFEDLGQHVLTFGKRVEPEALAAKIDALRPEDLARVASRMVSGPPTLAVWGDVAHQVHSQAEVAVLLK